VICEFVSLFVWMGFYRTPTQYRSYGDIPAWPVEEDLYIFLTWRNPKSLSGSEPTAMSSKWFEVNNLNHSVMGTPCDMWENNYIYCLSRMFWWFFFQLCFFFFLFLLLLFIIIQWQINLLFSFPSTKGIYILYYEREKKSIIIL
jgi:hypothetical protein